MQNFDAELECRFVMQNCDAELRKTRKPSAKFLKFKLCFLVVSLSNIFLDFFSNRLIKFNEGMIIREKG